MTADVRERIAINGNCFLTAPLDADLAFCDRHGLRHLTVPLRKVEEAGRAAAVRAMQAAAVEVSTMILPSLFTLDDPSRWPEERRRIANAVDVAAEVGARSIYTTTGPAGALDWERATDALASAVEPALEYAAGRGVRLLVETTNPMYAHLSFLFALHDALDLVERTGLGLVVDLFPSYHERDLMRTIARATGAIELVQVSDYVPGPLSDDNPGGLSVANRAVPGDGHAPLHDALRAILDTGYDGIVDLELFGPRIDREGPERAVLRGVDWIEQVLSETPRSVRGE
jgi:sugar phosphate isomerase/epimerase